MENPIIKALETESIYELCNLWIHTDAMAITNELATVRGAIMDILETRDPVAFDAWMDDYEAKPHKYFKIQ